MCLPYLKKIESVFLIITTYIGKKAAREPWNEFATQSDLSFWNNHGLLYDLEVILKGSEAKSSPWVLNHHALCKMKYAKQ
jgi:hypothetical protein